jgi:phosphoribosylglycinamide formyltransferase 1
MKVAIFASGGGSNALEIIKHFDTDESISVDLIVVNKECGAIEKAKDNNIPFLNLGNELMSNGNKLVEILKDNNIDVIALAGYLRLIPKQLIQAYPKHILNIHPALLPNYGGKGMYGMNVHRAVFENKEKVSGMTIHLVSEKYDEGAIIFQGQCDISECKSPEEIATEVLKVEHKFYPSVALEYFKSLK